ncbi:MAG: class I SAM-dependent methyltransferase [Candidatus Heimdallarchaeota archaeon]|nr:class I SAM-dependent methyltransferase [Candidatus Heimdallarchaeota archaeon]
MSVKQSKFLRTIVFLFQLVIKRIQKIVIDAVPEGTILDIGGGGEGIIAQIGRERVTAVDKFQSEIDGAKQKAPEANWILADAQNLDFSDGHFDSATSFFSIMYMSNKVKKEVFKEIYRVISDEGEFWIWDASISKEKGVFLVKIKVILPDQTVVRTGYGVSSKIQTVNSIKEMLEEVGFNVEIIESNKQWYFMKAKK